MSFSFCTGIITTQLLKHLLSNVEKVTFTVILTVVNNTNDVVASNCHLDSKKNKNKKTVEMEGNCHKVCDLQAGDRIHYVRIEM